MVATARRLRVAVDMTLLDGRVGGSAVYAQSLVEAVRAKNEVDVEIIGADRSRRLSTVRWIARDADKRVREVGADLIHCPAFLRPFHVDVPLVLTIHDLSLSLMPSGHPLEWRVYASRFLPRLARRATMIITPSETVRRDVLETYGVPPDRVEAIHSGVDHRFFEARQERTAAAAEPVILFPGAPIARKNLDIVLRSLGKAPAATGLGRARLEITGAVAADFPQYARLIADLGLQGRVKWLGRLDFEGMVSAYKRADVVAYPSFQEGFGFAPLEAMACGTPVVAANASCLPEVLGEGAMLVDPANDAAFAAAVESLLVDPDVRRRWIEAGASRARTFTWSRTAEMTISVYRRAVASVTQSAVRGTARARTPRTRS